MSIVVKPGDVKTATLLVASLLVANHKFSKAKAAEKATVLVKKAKKENPEFDGPYLTTFTEKELSASAGKTATEKKEAKPKPGLTEAQLKIANDSSKTTNERARTLLTQTNFTLITAIANALGVSFQRITNVRKNMQRPAKEGAAPAKKTATAKPAKKAATKPAKSGDGKTKRQYNRKAK